MEDSKRMPLSLSHKKSLRLACVVLLMLFALARTGMAQGPQEKKPTNLKVLDSTMTHDQLIAIMSSFTVALQVRCDYCHAQSKAGGKQELDFASDSLKTKLAARDMIRMVNNINGAYISHLPTADTPRVTVQCITCHRGQPKPILIGDLLSRVRKEKGLVAVDSVYRDLRQKYYGSATFDFSDVPLVFFALDVSKESAPDALAILKLNEEFNTRSALTEWAKGRIQLQMGDTAAAVTDYKRALEIDSTYQRAARELKALGVPPKQ